ncbi:MAG TPA: hypothetical protein VK680_10740 [Solirubrobacteraceae bacterium]|jgi:hypothetical protein|nr:hypothetical protein [Solirubrobacteraceae bacterium]
MSHAQDDDWLLEEPELPPRPRRRLFGTGANRVALALLGVLLIACGFIGGVLIEKGENSASASGSSASSLASRFAALRGGSSSTGARPASSAGGGFPGFAGAVGSGGRPTAGTVAYLAGKTLYVTNSEGSTIKVTTSAATSVKKTVTASVGSIHPGETVTVTGTSGSGGSIVAESISVGSSAGAALAALFGGSKSSTHSRAGGSGSGEPALFGSGG